MREDFDELVRQVCSPNSSSSIDETSNTHMHEEDSQYSLDNNFISSPASTSNESHSSTIQDTHVNQHHQTCMNEHSSLVGEQIMPAMEQVPMNSIPACKHSKNSSNEIPPLLWYMRTECDQNLYIVHTYPPWLLQPFPYHSSASCHCDANMEQSPLSFGLVKLSYYPPSHVNVNDVNATAVVNNHSMIDGLHSSNQTQTMVPPELSPFYSPIPLMTNTCIPSETDRPNRKVHTLVVSKQKRHGKRTAAHNTGPVVESNISHYDVSKLDDQSGFALTGRKRKQNHGRMHLILPSMQNCCQNRKVIFDYSSGRKEHEYQYCFVFKHLQLANNLAMNQRHLESDKKIRMILECTTKCRDDSQYASWFEVTVIPIPGMTSGLDVTNGIFSCCFKIVKKRQEGTLPNTESFTLTMMYENEQVFTSDLFQLCSTDKTKTSQCEGCPNCFRNKLAIQQQ
ncbi:hypothetical protein C9374_002532 [Naegleria lovaniensis]|uniref:Uncharacterized protein n=1 Tax=Naegleria lovaniensis TaxID=51637 RepID=A0AA88GPR5_NAELO|nr:uncharacterized protein C9374_002532 [Naegleria lovaniensis]KAG2386086.1 hypothetical protein C9374_002532 [Naegleria lovaniensis]